MGKIAAIAKAVLPGAFYEYLKRRACEEVFRKLNREYPAYRERMLKRVEAVRQKEVINVLFYIWHPSFWKVDSLFRLMLEHPRFNPAICPVASMDNPDPAKRRETLEYTRRYFKEKGYPVLEIDGIGPVTGSFVFGGADMDKIRAAFAPDVIFVQAPYESVPQAMAADMEHELYCYVPYCYRNSEEHFSYNNATQNKYWFNFVENEPMMDFIKSIMTNKGANLCLTGFPPVDGFLYPERFAAPGAAVWKPQGTPCKRVVWAPHWNIAGVSVLTNGIFPHVADRMLELAHEYEGRIQFAFKPHPKLKAELYMLADWGYERTDAYYKAWENMPNGQLEQGEYANLFAQSDALVHDSGSFIVEYMVTGNPCCFLHGKDAAVLPNFNEMTADCHAAHYLADSIEELERFLQEVVVEGKDPKAEERRSCVQRYIVPPNNRPSAQNIIEAILGAGAYRER